MIEALPDAPKDWYTTIKELAPMLGAACAFAIPFLYTWYKDVGTRRIESQKTYLDHRFELYKEVCKVAMRLATSDDVETIRKDEARFWQLYWGELCMVEDNRVERAMIAFGAALSGERKKEDLTVPSYKLAHAIRNSLEASWGLPFPARLKRLWSKIKRPVFKSKTKPTKSRPQPETQTKAEA